VYDDEEVAADIAPIRLGMEVNKMFKFNNVKESNFASLLRRSFVFRIQALFVDRSSSQSGRHAPNGCVRVIMSYILSCCASGRATVRELRMSHISSSLSGPTSRRSLPMDLKTEYLHGILTYVTSWYPTLVVWVYICHDASRAQDVHMTFEGHVWISSARYPGQPSHPPCGSSTPSNSPTTDLPASPLCLVLPALLMAARAPAGRYSVRRRIIRLDASRRHPFAQGQ
jgi:hypothetical protein